MKYILCLLCLAMFVLCIVVILDPIDEITRVELARSGAWSDRGAALSVDKTLRYNLYYTYLGHEDRPASGFYIGRVNKQFWDTLNRKLEGIDFKNIPASDNINAADVNRFELIVTWKTGKRRILRTDFGTRDSVLKVIHWLDKSYKRVVFIEEASYPIKFETTFQNDPPMPKIDGVKFPPPSEM